MASRCRPIDLIDAGAEDSESWTNGLAPSLAASRASGANIRRCFILLKQYSQ